MDILDTRENLNAMVLKHEQQIKDLAAHLLELKRLTTPMMMFKPEESELRDRLRETEKHLSVHQRLAAALMEPKPWVGLTGDEIVYLSKTVGNGIINDGRFARAIEAKLKEKNT